jgi:hypothetical protein
MKASHTRNERHTATARLEGNGDAAAAIILSWLAPPPVFEAGGAR